MGQKLLPAIISTWSDRGRPTPQSMDPPTFSPEEAWRGEKECDRRRKALEEIIRLGEGLE